MKISHRLLRRVKRSLDPAPQDLKNFFRYGRTGPIAHERIWINPREVRHVVAPHPAEVGIGPDCVAYQDLRKRRSRARKLVGTVIGDEIDDFRYAPLGSLNKIQACRKHWQEGLTWEEAGAIEALMFKITATDSSPSGCRTRDDVVRRYQKLDELFESIRTAGRLKSFARRKAGFRRELDGVQIHLGRDGEFLFGERGTHRLAMSLVLGFDSIPASLGFVHESALDVLPRLRRPNGPIAVRSSE